MSPAKSKKIKKEEQVIPIPDIIYFKTECPIKFISRGSYDLNMGCQQNCEWWVQDIGCVIKGIFAELFKINQNFEEHNKNLEELKTHIIKWYLLNKRKEKPIPSISNFKK